MRRGCPIKPDQDSAPRRRVEFLYSHRGLTFHVFSGFRLSDRTDEHFPVFGAVRGADDAPLFHRFDDSSGAVVPKAELSLQPRRRAAPGVGHEANGVRLVFERGRVVESSASTDEAFLRSALAMDEGAAVLGEFGIGCNRGIQRHTKNTLFDEKIYGTVHFALGNGFPFVGGTNVSALHWDMVKDLREGGRIECDGELVQENGEWRI